MNIKNNNERLDKRFGIINFSNNCYLNVIIQLFLSNKETSDIILNYLDFDNNKNILNPLKIMRILSDKIDITRQNDSQEVFIEILDKIKELEPYFENKIKNVYTCQECKSSRTVIDTFSTFYVHSNSLEDSVKELIKEEIFELECDKCKCNSNKNLTKTIKSCNIKKLGDILVFYNINKLKLTISENIIYNKKMYKLTGIIKHFGGKNSGHYIFIDYKNELVIDDSNIFKFKNDDNFSLDDIYLVFYT